MAKHGIAHIEFHTHDKERLKRFYGDVFGWTFEDSPGGYTRFDTGAKNSPRGGIMRADGQMPTGALHYVTVGDVAKFEEKVKAAGGQVRLSKTEVPGAGWYAIVANPDGTPFAIWESAPAPGKAKKSAKKQEKKAAKAQKKAAKKDKKKAKKQQAAEGTQA